MRGHSRWKEGSNPDQQLITERVGILDQPVATFIVCLFTNEARMEHEAHEFITLGGALV